jgi:hypothetical protein
MESSLEFSEYSFIYSNSAKDIRRQLSSDLKEHLYGIEDKLTEDPDQFPNRTIALTPEINIYRNPDPQLEITYQIDRKNKKLFFLHLVAPVLETTKPLFISYSHNDEEWLLELKKWLKPLEKENLIKIWDDKEIKAGDEWHNEIKSALDSAKAAVLLVSQDFLNSDFINNEELPLLLDAAKEKGVKIFWIAIKPSTIEDSEIIKYQAAHKDPPLIQLNAVDRDKEYLKIYKRIREAIN